MRIDPYKHKEKYMNWKKKVEKGIPDISEYNSDLILRYISDMENGLNVSSTNRKGSRSYIHLNNLRQRMIFLSKKFEEMYKLEKITEITEEQLHKHFTDMRNGVIKRKDGSCYKSVCDYVRIFKAFWHWYMKVSKKVGNRVPDITEDLEGKIESSENEKVKGLYRKLHDHYQGILELQEELL